MTDLPDYYFEDITEIQCKMISQQLDNLNDRIKKRIIKVSKVIEIGQKTLGERIFPISFNECGNCIHTFWQLVIPVDNLTMARDALFSLGVETGATNLMNLAEELGIELKSAKRLKENFIFIPIHEKVPMKIYKQIFICLKEITVKLK